MEREQIFRILALQSELANIRKLLTNAFTTGAILLCEIATLMNKYQNNNK